MQIKIWTHQMISSSKPVLTFVPWSFVPVVSALMSIFQHGGTTQFPRTTWKSIVVTMVTLKMHFFFFFLVKFVSHFQSYSHETKTNRKFNASISTHEERSNDSQVSKMTDPKVVIDICQMEDEYPVTTKQWSWKRFGDCLGISRMSWIEPSFLTCFIKSAHHNMNLNTYP